MQERYSFGDRVVVTSDNYSCADKGSCGTIVDFGYWSYIAREYRYLIRLDASPDMLYGIHHSSIAREEKL